MKTDLELLMESAVNGGWANESDGDVESPTGYFARVEICADWPLMADALDYSGPKPEEGHYFVKQDNFGFTHVYGPYQLGYVERRMREHSALYGEWLDNGDIK